MSRDLIQQARALEAQVRQLSPRTQGRLAESARRYVEGGTIPMANVEHLRAANREPFFPVFPTTLTPPAPPTRVVVSVEAGMFTVDGWCMATTDRVLAEAVAREFDRIDPLPGFVYPSIGTERTVQP